MANVIVLTKKMFFNEDRREVNRSSFHGCFVFTVVIYDLHKTPLFHLGD